MRDRPEIAIFKFGFIGLTEQRRIGKGDPHPSRLRRATFPQGKASTWNVRVHFITENISMRKGFSDNEERKTLAFPWGEGVARQRRVTDEGHPKT